MRLKPSTANPQRCQVVSPTKKGAAGIRQLNPVLQKLLNPGGSGKEELHQAKRKRPRIWREGDRLVQKHNNKVMNVCNGR